ncbi:uncharacterized protein EV422DRAFT_234264 [Fimicolochytrium jonesii]|uniref:uncharacterized protein n=1 Tax=Fimicolochytrium jonesii TaxID=1396493 RepID=UPI0022FDD7D3|nr:uncharacterized protein EV422DRAFT_234264 [Fimicolochytrium jonesii]KAI8824816.1 hypothetical protein EV422DRAFT_234264 [Fimicolochytrium jonesii]
MKKYGSASRLGDTGSSDALARHGLLKRNENMVVYEIHPSSKADANLKKLIQALTTWVNSYVIHETMTVRDLVSDLDDGQLLAAFLGQITGDVIADPNQLAAKSERTKVAILQSVVRYMEESLKIPPDPSRWTIEGIMNKDVASALCILVDLAQVLGCPYDIPPKLSVAIIRKEELPSGIKQKTSVIKITGEEPKAGKGGLTDAEVSLQPRDDGADSGYEPDAFDKLFAMPEKMPEVTKLLLEFLNSQLEGLNIRLNTLAKLECVYLILLIGTMGNFFVPLHHYALTPTTLAAKIDNAKFAISMMSDLEIDVTRISPTDLVRKDVKSISRCVFALFQAFNNRVST